jgi:hypothetical protein
MSETKILDSRGSPAGCRPGYCFDANHALIDAATAAYEAKRLRLSEARRGRADDSYDGGPPPPHARDVADRAWQDRKVRLSNAWRQK